jgi:ATP-dependent Lon protease
LTPGGILASILCPSSHSNTWVVPAGGIKMKVLAAHRAGLTTVILPRLNKDDLEELPEEVKKAITFVPVERIDEAFTIALTSSKQKLEV